MRPPRPVLQSGGADTENEEEEQRQLNRALELSLVPPASTSLDDDMLLALAESLAESKQQATLQKRPREHVPLTSASAASSSAASAQQRRTLMLQAAEKRLKQNHTE